MNPVVKVSHRRRRGRGRIPGPAGLYLFVMCWLNEAAMLRQQFVRAHVSTMCGIWESHMRKESDTPLAPSCCA